MDGLGPLQNARILLEPGPHSAITGPDGFFRLDVPAAGAYQVRVQFVGRVEARDSIFLTGRKGLRLVAALAQMDVGLSEC